MTRLSREDRLSTPLWRKLSDNKLIFAITPVLTMGAATYFARVRRGSVFHEPQAPEANPQAPQANLQALEAKSPSMPNWLQGATGIVAALGVLVALLYAVVNSAYVYFYELLGVTPEDVGFDRLAILARTAGLLLPGLILGVLLWAVSYCPRGKLAFRVVTGICSIIIAATVVAYLFRASRPWVGLAAIIVGFLAGVLYLGYAATMPRPSAKMAGKRAGLQMASWALLALVLLIGIRVSLVELARPGINKALQGQPVQLIQFVDFEAIPAHVEWLSSSTKEPVLLRDPYLLYLGSGPRGQVLLACGNVVTVPPDQVSVADGFHLFTHTSSADRKSFCSKYAQRS